MTHRSLMNVDIAIIGGGPGGLLAGLRLARHGFSAAVLEEHHEIGRPVHCTGVLASDAFDQFGLSRRSVLNELRTARFCSPSGRWISYTTPSVEAVVIDRATFDLELADQAARHGVAIHAGAKVQDLAVDATGVDVFTDAMRVRARAAVLACGANYVHQRRFGLGSPATFLQTAQLEVPCERHHDVELHFGSAIAPSGFGWAVPVRRDRPHVRVGVMCQRDAAGFLRSVLDRVQERWGPAIDECCRPRMKMLPLAPIGRTFSDRLLVIGDAAGLVKATTGGGIYYSLLSASLASDVLAGALRGGLLTADALSVYERRWRARLQPEFDAQLSLRRAAERLSDPEIEFLFELALTDGVMPIIRKTARFNEHRMMIRALLKHPPVRRLLFDHLLG
jgi:digeranylgeranylglycerophospholipid reductase